MRRLLIQVHKSSWPHVPRPVCRTRRRLRFRRGPSSARPASRSPETLPTLQSVVSDRLCIVGPPPARWGGGPQTYSKTVCLRSSTPTTNLKTAPRESIGGILVRVGAVWVQPCSLPRLVCSHFGSSLTGSSLIVTAASSVAFCFCTCCEVSSCRGPKHTRARFPTSRIPTTRSPRT